MKYNQLGKSDMKVSSIGLGCMSLPANEAEAIVLVHQALDGGINYFDTADIYSNGANERVLGKALNTKQRDSFYIATKVGNEPKANGEGWNWNPTKPYIIQGVEKSLKRLNTDYIDLYQLHGGTMDDPFDETIAAFEQLVQQGKIRYYGISSIRPRVINYYARNSNIVGVMSQYSLLDRRPEEAVLGLLKSTGISLLARGTVAKGLLVNKPADQYLNHPQSVVVQATEAVRALTGSTRSAAQVAIQYALNKPVTASAIVGVSNSTQLREAIETATAPDLSAAEIAFLQSIVPANYYD